MTSGSSFPRTIGGPTSHEPRSEPIHMTEGILGGLISGVVVFGGIFTTEALARARARRNRISTLVLTLMDGVGDLERLLREPWEDEKLRPGAPLPAALQRARGIAFELRVLTSGRRRHRDLYRAVNEVIARQAAAFFRYTDGVSLGEFETLGGRAVMTAAFPEGEDLGSRILQLRDEGLPTIMDADS